MGIRRASLLACAILLVTASSGCMAQWTPPPSPQDDPGVPDFSYANFVMFPSRDFITVENLQSELSKVFTTEVVRGGQTVGVAWSRVAKSDVAYEINHPGGYCWGDNTVAPAGKNISTDLKVTPDMRAGDKLRVADTLGKIVASGTILSQTCGPAEVQADGKTVIVSGTYGTDVTAANLECRIIAPDLVPTPIGKRDVRAVPGGFAAGPNGGYTSNLEAVDGKITATFIFNDANDAAAHAEIAAGGDSRMMTWEKTDNSGNRQSITIFEYGLAGGPGMGQCPQGPGNVGSPGGTYKTSRSSDKGTMTFSWDKPTAAAGSPAFTGYYVSALESLCAGGTAACDEKAGLQKIVTNVDTLTTALAVDPSTDYTCSIRVINADDNFGPKFKAVPIATKPSNTTGPPPAALTLNYNEIDGSADFANLPTIPADKQLADYVFYKFDAPAYSAADGVVLGALPYTGPFAFKGSTVHYVVFNDAQDNQFSGVLGKPTSATVLRAPMVDPPAATEGAAGQESVTASWHFPAGASATKFVVELGTDTTAGTTQPVPGLTKDVGLTLRTFVFTKTAFSGLSVGTSYRYRVTAYDGTASMSSTWSAATYQPTKVLDVITLDRVTWTNKPDIRVRGTTNTQANTLRLYLGSATAPNITPQALIGTITPFTPAVAPATGFTYDSKIASALVRIKPDHVWVVSICASGASNCGAQVKMSGFRRFNRRRL